MWTTLIVGCCLGISVHAGIIAPPSANTKPSPSNDTEKDLETIENICLTEQEHNEILGRKPVWTLLDLPTSINFLIREAKTIISLQELRASLGIAPHGGATNPFKKVNKKQLAAARTIDAYYELVEPLSEYSSDGHTFDEEHLPRVVAFLDKRAPEIRAVARRKFSEVRSRPDAPAKIDRKEVDLLIQEFVSITDRIRVAVIYMIGNNECRQEARKQRVYDMELNRINCPNEDSCVPRIIVE